MSLAGAADQTGRIDGLATAAWSLVVSAAKLGQVACHRLCRSPARSVATR